jgi:hypothetical protein
VANTTSAAFAPLITVRNTMRAVRSMRYLITVRNTTGAARAVRYLVAVRQVGAGRPRPTLVRPRRAYGSVAFSFQKQSCRIC